MKLRKAIVTGNGKLIHAGSDLSFAPDGTADFDGEQVRLSSIPFDALEYEMHDELNPAIWTDGQLKQDVREKLLAIANDFYESTGFKAPIVDIQLTGSLANYNYHDKSDLDTHILIDFNAENQDTELVKKAANALKWQWNMQHNITIAGYEVELYIQDVNEEHTASGRFSLLNDAWIVEPVPHTITTSEQDVNAKADSIKMQVDDIEERIDAEDADVQSLLNEVDELRYKALRLRKDAFEQGEDEFSVGNLAFKELRNSGYIEKLLNIENMLYDKLNTL